jgi:hypothetical protein
VAGSSYEKVWRGERKRHGIKDEWKNSLEFALKYC